MPYIDQKARERLGKDGTPKNAGELNYLVSGLIDNYLSQVTPLSYSTINEAIGVLECAKLEIYRRIASPYEDIKIKSNGDVFKSLPQE